MTDKENFNEIEEMKLLSEDPFDFDVDLSKITEEGLGKRAKRENIKDYVIFSFLCLAFIAMLITVSLVNIKLLMIIEIIIAILIPLSVIPITIYKIRRAELEN
ncbi:MAG: hypothetical protein LIR50_16005 [Bacillota bacterium]|nr:hypothetical protein [Bacillota bacterium]